MGALPHFTAAHARGAKRDCTDLERHRDEGRSSDRPWPISRALPGPHPRVKRSAWLGEALRLGAIEIIAPGANPATLDLEDAHYAGVPDLRAVGAQQMIDPLGEHAIAIRRDSQYLDVDRVDAHGLIELREHAERFLDPGRDRETDILPDSRRREIRTDRLKRAELALGELDAEGFHGFGGSRRALTQSLVRMQTG